MPFWEEIYQQAFPGFHAQVCHPCGSTWGQLSGRDRTIHLRDGAEIVIDEKIRYQDYGDILLEFMAVKERQEPGWVALDLAADFLAYTVLPSGVCYLLPVPLLRRAWQMYGEQWKKLYGVRETKNHGFTTQSCPVPKKELFKALVAAMRVTFEPKRQEKAS